MSSKSLTWHYFSSPLLHRYTGMVAHPEDNAISICFLSVTSSLTGPKWIIAVPPYSASVLYIILKPYNHLSLNYGSNIRGLTLEWAALELWNFDGEAVFYDGPSVTAWNGCGLRWVGVSGKCEGSAWVDKLGFTLHVETVLAEILSAFWGFALDPVQH